MLNIYDPDINNYTNSAIKAIKSGWISNHGEYVSKAVNKLKEVFGIKYAILMSNGTCATHCLFLALKYKYPEIRKIYVPNNCYVAAWNCVLMEYNKLDIEVMKMDIDTWNIKTDEDYINSLAKNSAVLIVHNLGNIINVPRLKKIRPDIIFIEDNCEGFTGKYDNMYSGTSSDTLCTSVSFYGNKIITTGEGGAFFTSDESIYNYINKVYSQSMSSQRYVHDEHAYNYRMTNIQAAFLYDQLNNIDEILGRKRKIFDNYKKLLKHLIDEGQIKLFTLEDNTDSANWIFAVRVIGNKFSIDDTNKFFNKNGIDIRPFFYPINEHKHLSDIPFNDDVSCILNNEVIMIPSSPTIILSQQKHVVDCISKFISPVKYEIINKTNIHLVEQFIANDLPSTFRYFQKRNIQCLENHILTVVIIDNEKQKVFGYAHIDYEKENNKHWFGICILPEYQNRKLGKDLLNFTLNNNQIKNIHDIYLTVDNDNVKAIKIYLQNNFQIVAGNDKYIEMKKII